MAEAAIRPNFAFIDKRLASNPWWYGERWSIVDAYINWVWFRVTGTAFDGSVYSHLARHDAEQRQRPQLRERFLSALMFPNSLRPKGWR